MSVGINCISVGINLSKIFQYRTVIGYGVFRICDVCTLCDVFRCLTWFLVPFRRYCDRERCSPKLPPSSHSHFFLLSKSRIIHFHQPSFLFFRPFPWCSRTRDPSVATATLEECAYLASYDSSTPDECTGHAELCFETLDRG